jgi:hypothetical protein
LCTTGKGKPRGLQAARKLRTTRRDNRWADKHYKRQALGTAFRFSPFGGSSHAKGIVLEKMYVSFALLFGSQEEEWNMEGKQNRPMDKWAIQQATHKRDDTLHNSLIEH